MALNAGEVFVNIRVNTREAEREVASVSQRLSGATKKASQAVSKVGKTMTKNVTLPIVGLGAAIVKAGMGFEQQMANVASISGATGSDLEDLTEKAKEMGASTKFSAVESAQAFEYMAMAGWKTTEMVQGLEGVMNLAAASGEDLAMVSDIVTDGLTAFGMSAEDSSMFADVLAATASNANTNVAMMGESFKYAAPVAGAMGLAMEDVALATGLMANSGIKASQAGTSLRTLLTNMANPTDSMAKAMETLGISLTDNEGNMQSLDTIMQQIRGGMGDLTEEQKAQTAAMLAGKTGMSGLLAIVNASEEDYNKLSEAINNSTGNAQQMADVRMDTFEGQITLLKSALESLAVEVFPILLPILEQFIGWVKQGVEWVQGLSKEQKENIVKWLGIAAAIGPVLLIISKVLAVISFLSTAFSVLAAVVGFLLSPIGLVVLAVGALIAIGILLWKNWDKVSAFLKASWESLKKAWGIVTLAIKTKVDEWITKFKALWETIKSIATKVKNKLADMFKFKIPKIKLPHFSIDGKFSLSPPSMPKLGVSWYKNGGLLNSPTLIGAGEAGKEAVVPLTGLGSKAIASELSKLVNGASGGTTNNFYISGDGKNSKEIAKEVITIMDRQVYRRNFARG